MRQAPAKHGEANQAAPPLHMTGLPRGGGLNLSPEIRLVEHVSSHGNPEIFFFPLVIGF